MYTRKLRSLDSNAHFDDDVTHAPLSVIRRPNTKLPADLQGDGYYYQIPSAEVTSHRTEPPPVYGSQPASDRGKGSSSSDDYVVRHNYNFR